MSHGSSTRIGVPITQRGNRQERTFVEKGDYALYRAGGRPARRKQRARSWTWSSTRAHLAGGDDQVVKVAPVPQAVGNFAKLSDKPVDEGTAYAALWRAETTGRPIGDADWLKALE